MGHTVTWEALSAKRACRIAVYRNANRDTFHSDEELIGWAVGTMVRFVDALRPRIKALPTPAALAE